MLGFFKRKRPSVLDATIKLMYGPEPPRKSADVGQAVALAHEGLLQKKVPLSSIRHRATELYEGPIPYSTHDLATSTALGFFKDPEWVDALDSCQMPARTLVFNWVQNGKVIKMLAEAFENSLYERYHPKRRAAVGAAAPDFAALISQLLMLQVALRYENPGQLLPDLKSSKLGAGYVFGFHDACIQMAGEEANDVQTETAQSYMAMFGQREGFALFRQAVAMQDDQTFHMGRLSGGEDYAGFIMKKVPPLGLQRILILRFDEQAVWRALQSDGK